MSEEIIRAGVAADAPKIKKLWNNCFQSLEDQRRSPYYLNHLMDPTNTLVLEKDHEIVSMIHRNTHAIMFNGRVLQASMLNGIATFPTFQKRGYMQQLMEVMNDALEHSELVTFVQTDRPSLFEPYGFQMVENQAEYTLTRQDVKRMTNFGCKTDPSPIDLLKVYSAFIRRFNGFYTRDLQYFVDYKKWIASMGGKIIAYYNDAQQIMSYATVLYDGGKEARIKECVYLDAVSLNKVLNSVLQERATVHLCVSPAENLKVLFPNAPVIEYGYTMARLNDPELFSRLFMKDVRDAKEAFAISKKPLNMNEWY